MCCVFIANSHSGEEQVFVVSGRGRFKRSEPAFLRLRAPPCTGPSGSVAQHTVGIVVPKRVPIIGNSVNFWSRNLVFGSFERELTIESVEHIERTKS